jgi:hypothetical protein
MPLTVLPPSISSAQTQKSAIQAGAVQATAYANLSGDTIKSPVAYIDVELPNCFSAFKLLVSGFVLSAEDGLACVFSPDNGATWWCDPANKDTYIVCEATIYSADGVSTYFPAARTPWSQAVFNSLTFQNGMMSEIMLFPGSAETPLITQASATAADATQPSLLLPGPDLSSCVLNVAATVPPTLARANLMRLLPSGNGDCNPPTSGETIIAGSWVLWGVMP